MCEIADCKFIEVGYPITINNERYFKRNVYIPYTSYFDFLKTVSPVDNYCSAYLYNVTPAESSELYGNLYLDFDDQNNIENAREDIIHTLSFFKIVYKIPEDQMKIYFSGNKGFHLIVPKEILGVKPYKNLNKVFRVIAEQVNRFSIHKTVDLKIYDNKRLFRTPNSINGKTGLYKIAITPNELRTYTKEQIYALAQKPRDLTFPIVFIMNPTAHYQYEHAVKEAEKQEKELGKKNNVRYNRTLKVTPYCIQKILENGATEGSRNITIACLTSFYKSSGKSLNETIELVRSWNERNVKPTPEREMLATIKSIFLGNKTYGCNTLRTITECNEQECSLKKKPKKEQKKGNGPHAININQYSYREINRQSTDTDLRLRQGGWC